MKSQVVINMRIIMSIKNSLNVEGWFKKLPWIKFQSIVSTKSNGMPSEIAPAKFFKFQRASKNSMRRWSRRSLRGSAGASNSRSVCEFTSAAVMRLTWLCLKEECMFQLVEISHKLSSSINKQVGDSVSSRAMRTTFSAIKYLGSGTIFLTILEYTQVRGLSSARSQTASSASTKFQTRKSI